MFLGRFSTSISTRLRRLGNRDRGSALLAVIGVMAVLVIITMTVATTTVSSLGFTSATRAGVQAQASAEAGIDFALAALTTGTCPASVSPAGAPKFSLAVAYSAVNAGDSWSAGCAAPAGAKRVKIVSTGTAAAAGVAGQSSGNLRTVEAIYALPVAGAPAGAGAAVYAYNSSGFGGSGELLSVNGSLPTVQIKVGDVNCTGGSSILGDLIAAQGKLRVEGSCKVQGSAWSSGDMVLTGGADIGGNATSSTLTFEGGKVGGSAWSAGAMKLQWGSTIGGSATALTLDLAGGNVKGAAWAAGNAHVTAGGVTLDGSLTARSLTGNSVTITGGSTIVPAGPGAGPAAPATPVVPNWVDFTYKPADWPAFSVQTLSGTCDFTAIETAVAAFGGGQGVLDARACTNGFSTGWQTLTISNNVLILAKKFDLGNGGITASTDRKIWLVTEDVTADTLPSCLAGGAVTLDGGFTLGTSVSAMIYTPCRVTIGSSIKWRGQVYAGRVTISGAAKLWYVPVGLPGVDLAAGTPSIGGSAPGASKLGDRLSIRDLSVP